MLAGTNGPALQGGAEEAHHTATRWLGTRNMEAPGLEGVSKLNIYILFLSFKTQPVVRPNVQTIRG